MNGNTKLVPRKKSDPPRLEDPNGSQGSPAAEEDTPPAQAPSDIPPAASLDEVWSGTPPKTAPPLAKRAGMGNNLTTFRWFYVLSIAGTALYACVAHYYGQEEQLVFVRFGVVIALTLWGFRLSPVDRPEAGYRVQTAGYLEALIGIAAALVPLAGQPGNFNLSQVALPIATSLGTSILGWLLGGELVGTHHHGAGGNRDSGPAGEMGEFSLRISEAHDRYLALVERITASLAQAGQAHLDLVRSVNDSGKEGARLAAETSSRIRAVQTALAESLQTLERGSSGGLVASAEQLKKSLEEASSGLKEGLQTSREATREFTEFLRQAKLLVQGLEEMMKYLASTKGKT